MELYKLELNIPGLPSSGNSKLGDHHMVQWGENVKWQKLVKLHSSNAGLPSKPLSRAKLTLIRHGSIFLDYDNLVISFKSVVDGLSLAGVLADDSWEVTYRWDVGQVKSSRKNAHIRVTVNELPYDGPDVKPRNTKKKSKKNRTPKVIRFVRRIPRRVS